MVSGKVNSLDLNRTYRGEKGELVLKMFRGFENVVQDLR